MSSNRRTARAAGIWFIITFVTSIPAALFLYTDVLDHARYIVGAGSDWRIAAGAFAPVDVTEVVLTLWAGMHGVASLIAMRRIRVRRDGFGDFAERAIGHTVRGLLRTAEGREGPRSS